jgi:hypothetical protein
MSRANYDPERDNLSRVVSHSMAQRWRCTRCDAGDVIAITYAESKDGVGILKRLDRAHRERSPLCIGRVDKQRLVSTGTPFRTAKGDDVILGEWQAGDLLVKVTTVSDPYGVAWVRRIAGTEKAEPEGTG